MGFVNLKPHVEPLPDETVMPDSARVWGDYMYVADGRPYRSDWHDVTIAELKRREGFSEVRRFDFAARRRAGVQ